MKKNHQGYIETENFGQSRNFLAFKIAIEDWSVYRTSVNKLGLEMKKNYQGYIRIKNFWPISHFCWLQNCDRRLAGLPAHVNNRYKLNFSAKRL